MIFRPVSRRQCVTRAPDDDGLDVLARVVRDHHRRAQHRRRRQWFIVLICGTFIVLVVALS